MDRDTRNAIERATQRARKLLEEDFAAQLGGHFDVRRDGIVAAKAGAHLSARQAFRRQRIVAAIEHKGAAGMTTTDSVRDYLRDAAFTTLNRFVALKMLEARDLVQECISKGEQSYGYREFCGMAPGLPLLPENAGYRLYIESLFDELSTEVKVLFDRRDSSSVLWPKRATFEQLLEILNANELTRVWGEDETIGWVYQFFNGQDERREMREESQAPRNSRELAVRNQFFTPRYVVQFLTDNTLGRIWYEMRRTNTVLGERCSYMVRNPSGAAAHRVKKDPRDIRVLDPACGSGHFLLYAFDLLITMYEEAYADNESPASIATGRKLIEDYPAFDDLCLVLPALILAHNLHGVDIDARCAQIAQLSLWMRAQRAYRDFRIQREARRPIRRSNIVIAEPMVTDEGLANEFIAKLGDQELGRVFTRLISELKLAGDLGLLLRIEHLVEPELQRNHSGELFQPTEGRIWRAIESFVAEERTRTSMRRRLFADDAAQGIGLLQTAEMKFDVVLMNPPFGPETTRSKKEFEKLYPRSKSDIFAAFVERGVELLHSHGALGAITSRTGFFLPSFQQWREKTVLTDALPVVFADLGLGVMDAALVEAAAYCLEKQRNPADARTVFLRTLEEQHGKDSVLLHAITNREAALGSERFELNPARFSALSRSPFAYWVSDEIRTLFTSLSPLESRRRTAKVGIQTSDDFRFLRLWWEISAEQRQKWFLFAKGGRFSPFYADIYLCVNWENDGAEVRSFCIPGTDRCAARPQNTSYFGRLGLTWPHRTKSELGFRVLPAGCAFGHKGPSLFIEGDSPDELLAQLAICRSVVFKALVDLQVAAAEPTGRGGAARSYDVGVLQRTPVPVLTAEISRSLASRAARAWLLHRRVDTTVETSHAFVLPLEIMGRIARSGQPTMKQELSTIQSEIEAIAFTAYGISDEDRAAIEKSAASGSVGGADLADDDDENDSSAVSVTDAVIAWLVGVAFGRFDARLASGARPIPSEPEPFDPLPVRSPGMWPDGAAEPNESPDILVDDQGHADDLAARVQAVAERVEIAVPESLRAWLAKEFFPLHIKMYSRSRRKAPIYWQLATPSAGYSVWIYIHGFSKDTLFRVQNEYAAPKLAHEERRLESLTTELRNGATASQRNELAAQETFVEELRSFIEEVKRVAPLWSPNRDDGVIINFAPLWRLMGHHRTWQKELKSTWDELRVGEYDWAHLAMHLWPERVVPKCAKDRSLAIAHGLEDVFWVEGTDRKWDARKTPARSVEDLVREFTSPAVKSALKSLVEAPAATFNGVRGRGGRGRAMAFADGGDA